MHPQRLQNLVRKVTFTPFLFLSLSSAKTNFLLPGLAGLIEKKGLWGLHSPGLSSRVKIPRLHTNLKPPPPPKAALPKVVVRKKKGDEEFSDEEKVCYFWLLLVLEDIFMNSGVDYIIYSLGMKLNILKNGIRTINGNGPKF